MICSTRPAWYVTRPILRQYPKSYILFLYSEKGVFQSLIHYSTGQNKPHILITRPPKNGKLPAPFYLTAIGSDIIYCHTCGRIITPRRSHTSGSNTSTPVKYCSDRCRRSKPGPIDHQIEDAFISLLQGNKQSYIEKYDAKGESINHEIGLKKPAKRDQKKGEHRIIVRCSEIQALVFGHQPDQIKKKRGDTITHRINFENWQSVDMENESTNLKQIQDDVSEAERSEQGRKRAEEKEMVKRAARRGVVFGFTTKNNNAQIQRKGKKSSKTKQSSEISVNSDHSVGLTSDKSKEIVRMCEAVMTPDMIVVEPSFAKGDWGIRWRDDNPILN